MTMRSDPLSTRAPRKVRPARAARPAAGAPAGSGRTGDAAAMGLILLPPEGGPGWRWAYRSEPWAHPETAEAINRVGRIWAARHPDWPPIQIIGIADAHGRHSPAAKLPFGRATAGRLVDIRPVGKGGYAGRLVHQDALRYAPERTSELVRLLQCESGHPLRNILFNDPCLRGVWPFPQHDDHLHVAFLAPGQRSDDPTRFLGTFLARSAAGRLRQRVVTGADLVWSARYVTAVVPGGSTVVRRQRLWGLLVAWARSGTRQCLARAVAVQLGGHAVATTAWGLLPPSSREVALSVLTGRVAAPDSVRAWIRVQPGREAPW